MHLRISLLLILIPLLSYAQNKEVAIGQWRVHLSYKTANSVTLAGEKIYCSSPWSFFSVDEEEQFEILSKIEGFSDVGISKVRYSEELKLLVICYNNGNIDILKGNTIINVSDIFRKSVIGSKNINHIEFDGKYAYLSCDFGLVVLDCIKYEVKETFDNLSPDGVKTIVYSSTKYKDSLFLATNRGVMGAYYNINRNLQEYKNWHTYVNPGSNNPNGIASFNNRVVSSFGVEGVYQLQNGKWVNIAPPFGINAPAFTFISKTQSGLLFGALSYIFKINEDFTLSLLTQVSPHPTEALIDNAGHLWVADKNLGLITNKFVSPEILKPFQPNGPYTPFAWSLSYFNNKVVGVPGGYKASTQKNDNLGGFYTFEDNEWKNYDLTYRRPALVLDIVKSLYNPYNKNFYIASFQSGLIGIRPDSSYFIYDTSNSTLTNSYIDHPFVSDMALDSKGRMWVVNTTQIVSPSLPTLHVMNANGTWGKPKAFNNEMSLYLSQVVVDDNDYKWIRTMPEKTGGIIVYDSEKDRTKILSSNAGGGGLRSDKVYCMAKDKKGQVWVGTDKGVSIFYQPYTIFNNSGFDAASPYVGGFPLLWDQTINCIKVDGGNRKWIGTTNGGWLFNEDGTIALENFTIDNSPLLSNNIKDIQINDVTGEVFFATDKGIISYRGTATAGDIEFGTVKAFPNPVLPDFKGTIGITGLAADVSVKITDMFGNLVYQSKAHGGMATWDAKMSNGKLAKSGLYLVFCADETGTEKLVTKIAIVD